MSRIYCVGIAWRLKEETHTCHTQYTLATHNQSCSALSRYCAQVQTAFLSQVFIPFLYMSLSSLSCPFPPYFKNFWAMSTTYRESLCLTNTDFIWLSSKSSPLKEKQHAEEQRQTSYINTWARQYYHLFFSCIYNSSSHGPILVKMSKVPHSSSSRLSLIYV